MPRSTPGRWFDYFQGPIFGIPGSTTVLLIPFPRTFYIDYISFSTFNALPEALGLYLAGDGVPIILLNKEHTSTEISFSPPLAISGSLTMGGFGTLDGVKNMLVAYCGQMT
jgi:hypothetical protein